MIEPPFDPGMLERLAEQADGAEKGDPVPASATKRTAPLACLCTHKGGVIMRIDDELIERLLYEEESETIDFKGDQYKFVNATDEKSDLLQDILSFSNAWRRVDAFILVGVREVKGGRNRVAGIAQRHVGATRRAPGRQRRSGG